MAIKNRVLIVVLALLAVLGFVLSKYVVADAFGENRIFEIAWASILTFVAAGFLLKGRKMKHRS